MTLIDKLRRRYARKIAREAARRERLATRKNAETRIDNAKAKRERKAATRKAQSRTSPTPTES